MAGSVVVLLMAMMYPVFGRSADYYLDRCMLLLPEISRDKPGPQPDIECNQYSSNACCLRGASEPFRTDQQVLNITYYNHCPQKPSLNPRCHHKYFEELCFFLCSPDVGPWITIATHDEPVRDRFLDIPICASVCDEWWDACKDEYTCTDNWYTGFDMSTGSNVCRDMNTCAPYTEVFKTAKNFCESIWDFSFMVVADDQPCMKFVYDPATDTNNKHVAEAMAAALAARDAEKEEL